MSNGKKLNLRAVRPHMKLNRDSQVNFEINNSSFLVRECTREGAAQGASPFVSIW